MGTSNWKPANAIQRVCYPIIPLSTAAIVVKRAILAYRVKTSFNSYDSSRLAAAHGRILHPRAQLYK